ncbi:hypothetical protein NDU88_002196 [Pleurodeles waltl]|uniref:Uncharacterized protein n=1 Tax=Pleurodeles waltl TaxID=8319 RepID=A0AAV7RA83_PLEWA|nr:hypothetical protein NDU88_002196 [Pleurodeles waltl]
MVRGRCAGIGVSSDASGEQRFAAFPTLEAGQSAFLNAMFSILNRAMAPAGAPAGPTGPFAFTLGLPVPYKQALFVPFYPGEGAGLGPMTTPPPMMLQTAPMESMLAPDGSCSTHNVSPSSPLPERPSALKPASLTSANSLLMPRLEPRLR